MGQTWTQPPGETVAQKMLTGLNPVDSLKCDQLAEFPESLIS